MLKLITWTRVKWTLRGLLALIVVLFLHYTLPQHDIVRITDVYNRITQIGSNRLFYAAPDVGTGEGDRRDIRFIAAVRPNGKVIVYRNEDTGWVWPPYFKYDSSNLQAEAAQFESTSPPYRWVSITHYGWRIAWLSIYPNAVAIKPVAGPDVRIIPWANIIILTMLALLVFMARRMWLQFRERAIDPLLEDAGEAWDKVDEHSDAARDHARGLWQRFRAWLARWSGKSRR